MGTPDVHALEQAQRLWQHHAAEAERHRRVVEKAQARRVADHWRELYRSGYMPRDRVAWMLVVTTTTLVCLGVITTMAAVFIETEEKARHGIAGLGLLITVIVAVVGFGLAVLIEDRVTRHRGDRPPTVTRPWIWNLTPEQLHDRYHFSLDYMYARDVVTQ
jgi:hypothetical protein